MYHRQQNIFNVTIKGCLKANFIAHNNKSQIYNCGQISLQSALGSGSFSDNLTPLRVSFIFNGKNTIGERYKMHTQHGTSIKEHSQKHPQD